MSTNTTALSNEESIALKIAILVPSVLSFTSQLALALIIIIYRTRQTVLSKFVFTLALSDLIYSFMGIFFTWDRYFKKCPGFLSSTREYTRLVSCCICIVLAYTTSLLTRQPKINNLPKFLKRCFMFILIFPFIYVLIFLMIFPHEYLDLICWPDIAPEQAAHHDAAKIILRVPLAITFLITIGIYASIILYIKRRMEEEGNYHFSAKLYELLIYPMGIIICYIWFFIDHFKTDYDFVRTMDIISQQMQGLVNFAIFGLNYQTRTMMKDYWTRISDRMYEFFHLRERDREDYELQHVPLNQDYK